MNIQMLNTAIILGGFLLGGLIGHIFGSIQNAALSRHRKTEQASVPSSGWALIPGSLHLTSQDLRDQGLTHEILTF